MNLHKAIPEFLLKPDEVHVWLFRLDDLGWIDSKWGQLLSEEEENRSRGYKFETDRLRFIARRGILRLLLSRYCGMSLEQILYQVNQHGKLSLPTSRISFNLSSSQDQVAVAFVLEKEIGIDVEQVRRIPDFHRLAQRWFSLDEQAGLLALPPHLQTEAFFHIWTQKEAFIKARGDGLAYPLKDFSVSVDPNQPARVLSIKNELEECQTWKMSDGLFDGAWRAAVCIRMESEPRVEWHMPVLADLMAGIHPPVDQRSDG